MSYQLFYKKKFRGSTRCDNLNVPIVIIILSKKSLYSLYFVDNNRLPSQNLPFSFLRIFCVRGSGIEKQSALKSLFEGFLIKKLLFGLRIRNNPPYGSIGRWCMS